MKQLEQIKDIISKHSIRYIKLAFCSYDGKWQEISVVPSKIILLAGDDEFSFIFNYNDLRLDITSDFSRYFICPFAAQPSLVLLCDAQVINHVISDNEVATLSYQQSRSKIIGANNLLSEQGKNIEHIDAELEFFIFDNVRYSNNQDINKRFAEVDSDEFASNSEKTYEFGNHGNYNPDFSSNHLAPPPIDALIDLRAEICSRLIDAGISVASHFHGNAPAKSVISFATENIISLCDDLFIAKYIIKNTAHAFGKSACFMPKPMNDYDGCGVGLKFSFNDNNITGFYQKLVAKSNFEVLSAIIAANLNSHLRLASDNVFCKLVQDKQNNKPYIYCNIIDSSNNIYHMIAAMIVIATGNADAGDDGDKIGNIVKFSDRLLAPAQLLLALDDMKEILLGQENIFTEEEIKRYIIKKQLEFAEPINSNPQGHYSQYYYW